MAEEGRVDNLQEAASSIGYSLLVVSHYRIDGLVEQFSEELRSIGRDLHLLETERLYCDGGQPMRRIVERVHDLTGRLQILLETYQL